MSALPPAYAPPGQGSRTRSSVSQSHFRGSGSTNPRNKEIKLHRNTSQRKTLEMLKDLYSLIKTTEHLEMANVREAISNETYALECASLISKFNSAEKMLQYVDNFKDTKQFMKQYKMDCHRAAERLLVAKEPAKVVTYTSNLAATAAQTVHYFIGFMDAIDMDTRAIDDLEPTIRDIQTSLQSVEGLPKGNDVEEKVAKWRNTMKKMRNEERWELTEDEARTCNYDIRSAYDKFHSWLKNQK
eukprot:g3460.t1